VPSPLDAEISARCTAAVDAALAALRDWPPARCERCGRLAHDAHFMRVTTGAIATDSADPASEKK
jgi:hypothetical protein